MNEDVRRLLGGYATGSLTDAERTALYQAALRDSQLFEALADEHALRELLEDPAARAEVLRATESPRFSLGSALGEWFSRPKGKVLGSLLAALIIAAGVQSVMDPRRGSEEPQQEPNLVAQAPAPRSEVAERGQAEKSTRQLPPARRPKAGGSAANSTPPPPPPAAAPQAESPRANEQEPATRTAVAADLQLQYTVLLQANGGEPRPVPPQHPFADADRVLIRFESQQPGWLTVQHRGGMSPSISQIGPGTPVLYPVQAASRVVEVMFSRHVPTPAEARPFRALSDTATRYKVPEAAQGTSVATMPSTPPNTLALRIVLGRKKD